MVYHYHEWFIEFEKIPKNIVDLAIEIDNAMQRQNSYYFDLIKGKILKPLVITVIKKGGISKLYEICWQAGRAK